MLFGDKMDQVIQVVSGLLFNSDRSRLLIVNNIGGSWSPPGGGVEKGEWLEPAMIREAYEETGLHVRPQRLVAISEGFNDRKGHKLVFFNFLLALSDPDQEPTIQHPDEIAEIRWATPEDVVQKLPYLPFDPWAVVNDSIPRLYRTTIL